uniref:Uncharacterized protein n=1 Tax=Oryza glumipatula TaxID=40148 RepID=A0A0D9YZI2_9ORYZ
MYQYRSSVESDCGTVIGSVRYVQGSSCVVGPSLTAATAEEMALASWLASRCACAYVDVTTAENGAGVMSSAVTTTSQLHACNICSIQLRRRRGRKIKVDLSAARNE